MIALIIKSYFTILFSIGICAVLLLIVGLYFIIRTHLSVAAESSKKTDNQETNDVEETSDLSKSIEALVELTKPELNVGNNKLVLNNPYSDMSEIAGDDIATTQLDLAKALIETGKVDAAKNILQTVIAQGSQSHQAEARKLLKSF